MKTIITRDTITLIKRRYEIRGPFDEILERPHPYYRSYIKGGLLNRDCYRTYSFRGISNLKLWALDYKTLFASSDTESRSQLINKQDNLKTIKSEITLLNEIINAKTNRVITDARYKKLIMDRFGSVKAFADAAQDIEDYTESKDDDKETTK
jgi:hypothetical protein